jgi:hypothetical protein
MIANIKYNEFLKARSMKEVQKKKDEEESTKTKKKKKT